MNDLTMFFGPQRSNDEGMNEQKNEEKNVQKTT